MQRVVTRHVIDHKPRATDFTVADVATPDCPENGILVQVAYVSVDPYSGIALRGRHFGFPVPEPMLESPPTSVVGQVIESRCAGFAAGDWAYGDAGWEEIAALPAGKFYKIDPDRAPLSAYVGVLGMPGVTAWASAKHLAKVTQGDVVLVNAAAGPVGGTFGQLARVYGAQKVVGVAGGSTKCELVCNTYGFDACIDYKSDNWTEQLSAALPDGLTVFHENVSAEMTMLALSLAQPYARGVLCGLVDAYHGEAQGKHPVNAGAIIAKRAQLSGLVVFDFMPRYQEFVDELVPLISSGQLNYVEDSVDGLENLPALFEKLVDGNNIGKTLVAVNPPTS